MKHMKKLCLIFLVFSTALFADGGFEFVLNGSVGMSTGIHILDIRDPYYSHYETIRNKYHLQSEIGLDAAASAQFGYLIEFDDDLGLSVLAEVGYSRDTYNFKYPKDYKGETKYNYTFDSLQVGLLPKFNIGSFAIGVGGGIKLPLSGARYTSGPDGVFAKKYTIDNMRSDFEEIYIPYVKLTFDYSLFFTDGFALNLGTYIGYDIGLEQNRKNLYIVLDDSRASSFDVGFQVGLRFAPKL